MPTPFYQATTGSPLLADREFYGRVGGEVEQRRLAGKFIVPMRSGKAWPVRAGQNKKLPEGTFGKFFITSSPFALSASPPF